MHFYLILAVLILLFIFLRFFNIENSLFFQNDMGRDFLVMYDWYISGKIPLLGPQSSALPINQSAFYFYFLYPFFVLTNMSFFSTILANSFFYIVCFILSLSIVKERKDKIIVLLAIFLIVIHPEVIVQNRYVWNPSFVVPFLLVAFSCLLRLINKWDKHMYFIFWIGVSFAVSMSFSVLPLFVSFFVICLVIFRKRFLYTFLFSIFGFIIANIPTLIFEIRNNFLITKALFNSNNSISNIDLFSKASNLGKYILPSFPFYEIALGLFLAYYVIFVIRQKNILGLTLLIGAIISVSIILFTPIQIHSHYVFGVLMLLLFMFGLMPNWFKLGSVILLSIFWLNIDQINSYQSIAPRTVDQLNVCFKKICNIEKDPMFVSVQAGFHNYHVGPEFRYLMKKNNCSIRNIEQHNPNVQKMALVVDQSSFTEGKTDFMELSQFGKYEIQTTYLCQGNVQTFILKRNL